MCLLDMTMKRFSILTLALLLMLGCSSSGLIEQRIGKKVDSCKPDTPCIIRIKDLSDFQWDQLYVFSYGTGLDEIQKVLDTSFPDYVEFKRRLVFLKDGKIVHREDEPTNIEHSVDGQVSFAESYTEPSHWLFTPETAVFRAERIEDENGVYYTLKQVK
jgi:hypothetical protein